MFQTYTQYRNESIIPKKMAKRLSRAVPGIPPQRPVQQTGSIKTQQTNRWRRQYLQSTHTPAKQVRLYDTIYGGWDLKI